VAWHWIPPTQQLPEQMRGWWEMIHLSIGHNKKDSNANPYQLGGVAMLSCNSVVHWVASLGQDPMGLGRFCWTTYWGKNNLTLQILAGYWPCKTENGHLSVIQQHWQYQEALQPDNLEHPHSTFWTDLRPLLQEWTMQGNQIIMGIDANKDIRTQEITSFFNEFGMSKVILAAHGQDAPPHKTMGTTPLMESYHPGDQESHMQLPE